MTAEPNAPIVVGVDGSRPALAATRWAAAEATRRQAPLQLWQAARWPDGHHVADMPLPDQSEREFLAAARRRLDEALAIARDTGDTIDVTTQIRAQSPIEMLVEASTSARLVVLGSRGLGGFKGLLLGSTAIGVTARADGPVVVVQEYQAPQTGPVVVGLDNSAADDATLEFAFDAAASRGTNLVAVHTWHEDAVPYARDAILIDWASIRRAARENAKERIASVHAKYPSVTANLKLTRNKAAIELVERSESAQLVVVGSRGRGEVAGFVLGSTSQTLIRHAGCPVAVVRHRNPARPEPTDELAGTSATS
jgi:nucleotide-binding universal stress UspA family protein